MGFSGCRSGPGIPPTYSIPKRGSSYHMDTTVAMHHMAMHQTWNVEVLPHGSIQNKLWGHNSYDSSSPIATWPFFLKNWRYTHCYALQDIIVATYWDVPMLPCVRWVTLPRLKFTKLRTWNGFLHNMVWHCLAGQYWVTLRISTCPQWLSCTSFYITNNDTTSKSASSKTTTAWFPAQSSSLLNRYPVKYSHNWQPSTCITVYLINPMVLRWYLVTTEAKWQLLITQVIGLV